MRVYRNNLETFNSSQYFPVYEIDGICYAQDRITRSHLQPKNGVIVKTGSSFKEVSVSIDIQADKYYRLDGLREGTDELLWTEIDAETASEFATLAVFDIMEATYTGDDMGERKVVANIKYPTPIGFRIGDYIEIAMQSLTKNDTTIKTERFYIYSEPQCKKIARPMAAGDSFETIVTFYPPQYELGCIVLRDSIQEMSNVSNIIYTGFDTVTFEGGAFALLTRCVACMNAQFVDNDGNGLWSFDLAESLHEDNNRALERYLFSFSKTSVADALLKLNDPEQINTTFFINGRTIYAGYKRSYVCKVGSDMGITDVPMKFAYGKTSHLPVEHERGLLKNIFKSIGEEVPITKLFAYGATRNINRYYCADLIASGRYVNKLMLPSFSQDGHTDFVISEDGVKKFGMREGSKEFDNIYPTIQHMTYADIRGVKYCIKIKASGDEDDTKLESGLYDKQNSISKYAVARIQCYRVTPCTGNEDANGNKDGEIGANKLVPCAPPEDLVVTVRATGKVVKCILRGGSTEKEAIDKQIASDGKWSNGNGRVPATSYHGNTYIPGACFCVHDNKFPDGEGKTYKDSERDKWFNAKTTATTDSASELHRMEYVDTVLITDVYAFESYQQTHFRRDGYSAGCWARINNDSGQNDTLLVNEVVAVEPVIITDTDTNTATNSNQKTWDLYLRDLGFSPDEQNDFGDRVFVFDTIKVSFLDGLLTGREFTIAGSMTDNQDVCVCAYNNDGTRNKYFFEDSGYTDGSVPQTAFAKGAIWRFRLNRLNDEELENLGIIIPTKTLCAKEGDHVTLLDIYMPDVYVRAAENRLLKEAMKYLRHNDKGDVKYTAEFDQVRINQIPNYALQMREGVRVRLVDDDLNITTENTTRKIIDYPNGLESQISMFTIEQELNTETHMYFYRFQSDITDIWNKYDSFKSHVTSFIEESNRCTISLPRNGGELSSVEAVDVFVSPQARFSLDRKMVRYTQYPLNILTTSAAGENWLITFECTKEMYNLFIEDYRDIQVELYENVITTESYKYSNKGQRYYAIPDEIIDFTSGKFYDVVLDVESAFAGNQIEFLLCKSKDVESTKYIPAYTITELAETGVKEGFTRIKVSFFLDDSFDDSVGYYPAVKYIADGNTEYTSIRLLSVTEKDVDEDGNILNYADVTVDHVTVKITDNTRGANTRILDSYPEPIREIQATFNSNKKATSWAKVMSRVGSTEQEVEARKTTFQSIINDARRNYRALLSLRNSIFDPDSNTNDKCDYNFLRVMMMQVGADSMNYLLDKTYQSADGQSHNYSISRSSNSSNPVFNVNSEDKLSHLVYVQSGENGHWTIPAPFSQELQQDNDGTWSPYFVCIRCRKDGANALDENAWICSKHQYAVNQDVNPETGLTTDQYGNPMTDYWYFNWAILTCPNNDGDYVLRETRGNAYMYGDNLICGKISDLAQKSYFDLTNGDFVLGQTLEGNAALSYINGVLTIGGFNPDNPDPNIEAILKKLGIVEGVASGAQSTADAASAAAKNAQDTADGAVITANGAAASAEAAVTAAQAAEGRASALEYLATALGNYTAIAGGLIVTSQMHLGDKTGKYVDQDGKEYTESGDGRTEQYRVNAGISGMNDDNILLWGGGTYTEAVIAEKNNYMKDQNGNLITTLIKRNGTGKIGICRITDSELTVNIKGKGSVIIDASENNGGIRFFNNDGMLVSGIILGSIDGYSNAPLDDATTTGEDTIDYNKISEQYIGVGENSYTLKPQSNDVPQEGVVVEHENNYVKTTTTSITKKSITVAPILIDGSIEVQVKYGSNTPTGEFTIDLYNDNGKLLKTDVSRFDFENQGGSNYIYKAEFEEQTLFVNSVIEGYDGNVNVIVTLNLEGDIIITNCSLILSQRKDNYCKYETTTTISYSYHSYTLVGSDGFVSVKDNKKYYVIDNSGKEQKILTSGLPVLSANDNPETQGIEKGQLYVVNGTLKVY